MASRGIEPEINPGATAALIMEALPGAMLQNSGGLIRRGAPGSHSLTRTVPGEHSMQLKKGYQQLIDEARAKISTLSVAQAQALHGQPDTVFVDIRDVRELEREGLVPGAFHAPRGMLEFWADPASPYYKAVFGSGKQLVLYCQSAWRSSLAAAALTDMGVPNVCHFEGGFKAWKDAGAPVAQREPHHSKA